jgi:hypothetical protein
MHQVVDIYIDLIAFVSTLRIEKISSEEYNKCLPFILMHEYHYLCSKANDVTVERLVSEEDIVELGNFPYNIQSVFYFNEVQQTFLGCLNNHTYFYLNVNPMRIILASSLPRLCTFGLTDIDRACIVNTLNMSSKNIWKLTPTDVIDYYDFFRGIDTARETTSFLELTAVYHRIRGIVLKLYKKHIERKWHPSSQNVHEMISSYF